MGETISNELHLETSLHMFLYTSGSYCVGACLCVGEQVKWVDYCADQFPFPWQKTKNDIFLCSSRFISSASVKRSRIVEVDWLVVEAECQLGISVLY